MHVIQKINIKTIQYQVYRIKKKKTDITNSYFIGPFSMVTKTECITNCYTVYYYQNQDGQTANGLKKKKVTFERHSSKKPSYFQVHGNSI